MTDSASLAAALRDIWTTHNGIRHAWELPDWPFPLGSRLNEQLLLSCGHKIVFLHRKNALRRIVSHFISSQSRVWSYFDAGDRQRLRSFAFGRIDLAWVADHLPRERSIAARYRQLLSGHKADFLEISYEELYEPTAPDTRRLDALSTILEFLGRDPITELEALGRVTALFDRNNTKLNSAETYRLIPGIEEVERKFGSEENGWLFREARNC